MFATSCYKGYPALDYAKSKNALFLKSGGIMPGVEWVYSASVGCPCLPRSRNALVAEMLAPQEDGKDCDGILFVDDDIGFEPEDVARLIGHGSTLIAAVPQKRNHRWDDPARMAISPEGLRLDLERGLAIPPSPKLPMAMTFIHRSVFEDIREQGLAQPYIYPSVTDRAQPHLAQYFGYEIVPVKEGMAEAHLAERLGIENAMHEDGEDHYFCRRAAEAGHDPVIDIDIRLRHWEGQVCHDATLGDQIRSHVYEMHDVETGEELLMLNGKARKNRAKTAASLAALPTVEVAKDKIEGMLVVAAFTAAGLTNSNSEARRLIKQGAARLNDATITDQNAVLSLSDLEDGVAKLSAGKKRHALVKAVELEGAA